MVTVSGGVTSLSRLPAAGDLDEMISSADASLYRAKVRRNCVLAATETSASASSPGQPRSFPLDANHLYQHPALLR